MDLLLGNIALSYFLLFSMTETTLLTVVYIK